MRRFIFALLLLSLCLFCSARVPQRAIASDPRCADTFIASPLARSTQGGVMLITGRAHLEELKKKLETVN